MNTKCTETLTFEGHEIDVTFKFSPYYPATLETPEEGGEIELLEIKYMGVDVLWLFLECDKEEEIIELLIKQTN
jgi:hypothetical protein